jgi:predicted NBD/HSP70 family sugar kinase
MFDFTEHHFNRIMDVLGQLHRRIDVMALDVSKLTAAEVQLVASVDALLAASAAATTQLAAVSAQLAVAVAANDPAALAVAQKAIDDVTAALVAEANKVAPPAAVVAAAPVAAAVAAAAEPVAAAVDAAPVDTTGASGA